MSRIERAKAVYAAFAAGDRDAIENLLAEDFSFHAPPDPQLDRAGYFERCWPHSGGGQRHDFVRLIESGDEVVVTYEAASGRNTEVLTFDADDRVTIAEVYFGWSI
jgi:ketosteroid isomerase-like protein